MEKKREKMFKILSIIIFILYLLLVLWVVILKCNIIDNVTQCYYALSKMSLSERILRELNPIGLYTNPPIESEVPNYFRDDVLNVLLFIPFGIYLSIFIKNKKVLKTGIIAFCSSLLLETFQLFTILGAFSTKDLITNTLGSLLGTLIYILFYNSSRIRFFNILSIAVILLVMPVLLFAITNTVRYMDIYLGVLLKTL